MSRGSRTPKTPRPRGLATRAVHPRRPSPQPGEPIAPSLELTSTYSFDDSQGFARATAERAGSGYIYARWGNRTVDAFEAAMCDLEGAEEAEAFASGMAAISAVFLAMCSGGDKIVAARQIYGNSHSLLAERLPRYGIEGSLCDVADYEAIEKALTDGARLLFCETIGNPRVVAADLDRLGELAEAAGVPFMVDNTFASPVLCRPIEHGAAIVVHSATKYLGGHHDLLGGIVCTSSELIEPIRAVARDFGGSLAPFNAWLALRGLATLPLRVARASDSALEVARALESSPHVDAVYYPALESDPGKPIADALFGGRGGGTLGFDVAGGRARAKAFQDELRLVERASSLGGTHTLIVHAASITHTQLTPEELAGAGINEGFCRLSVGLEDPRDLIADLNSALEASS